MSRCQFQEGGHSPVSMSQVVPILAVLVWVTVFLLYRPAFFRRPVPPGRRWLLALIQAVPILILCWLLANPFAERSRTETREGVVLVLVDDSPSMGFEDGSSGGPRIETARLWAEDLVSRKRVEGAPGSWEVRPLSDFISKGRSGSDFAEAFEGVRRQIPNHLLDGVLFLSDGQDRSEASLNRSIRNLSVPVHTLGLGPVEEKDRIRVRWRDLPGKVHPSSPFLVRWAVDSNLNREELASIRVTFASEEVLQEQLALPEGRQRREDWLRLDTMTPGDHPLRIEVSAVNRPELSGIAEATITVVDKPRTILVLESEPTRLVRSLVQTALDSGRCRILRLAPHPEGGGILWDSFRPTAAVNQTTEPPWSEEKRTRIPAEEWGGALAAQLEQTSVVVLGRNPLGGAPTEWTQTLSAAVQKQPLDWLVLPGSDRSLSAVEGSPLSNLLQRSADRRESRDSLRLLVSEEGRNHPALAPVWNLREGVWEIGRDSFFYSETPTTEVLIADPQDRSLIVQVPFGLGKATLVSTANLWKLGALSPVGDGTSREMEFLSGLWLGILDDLSGRERFEEVAIRLEPEIPSSGQSVRIRVQDPSIVPGSPRGGLEFREVGGNWRSLLITPDPDWSGLGEAVWTPRVAGDYEIRYSGSESPLAVTVVDRPSESGDESMDEAVLREIAESSGGTFTPLAEVDLSALDLGPRQHRLEKTDRAPLRHDLWIGILTAGLFCLGWGLRRLWSLP